MKLSELYQERMAANPDLTRKMLVEAVGSATVYAVQHDVPRKFRKGTLQKLAELWKCSIGDIQACLAEIDDPRRKDGPEGKHKPITVMQTVDKLEQIVSEKLHVAPEPEEVYELTEEEKELNGVESFEELKKKQHPEGGLHLYNVKRPAEEEIDVKPLLLETTAADYQSYLRGLILQQLMEAEPGTMVEALWISIGRLVAREVL